MTFSQSYAAAEASSNVRGCVLLVSLSIEFLSKNPLPRGMCAYQPDIVFGDLAEIREIQFSQYCCRRRPGAKGMGDFLAENPQTLFLMPRTCLVSR